MKTSLSLGLVAFVAACGSSAGPSAGEASPAALDAGASAVSSGAGAASPGGAADATTTAGVTARASCKRGVAYGHHSTADLRALSRSVTWWYNWGFVPDDGVRDSFASLGVAYVPMVWGAGVDLAQVAAAVLPGAPALLGFNEPNFGAQANLSAAEAARLWPGVQEIAAARSLTMVSPAVNFCGGSCQDQDPFHYLETFLSACSGCRVDALAVHVYVSCQGDGKNRARYLIDHLQTYERRFPQPIWLTEFACDDAKSDDEQRAFVADAVTYLEGDPRIARYAFFSGRADNVPHASLLGADGTLTAVGRAYVDAPAACGVP